jgi:hypothetical protein
MILPSFQKIREQAACSSDYSLSALGPIVLQKSFCIADHKISEPWARFSCKDVGGHVISRLTHQ